MSDITAIQINVPIQFYEVIDAHCKLIGSSKSDFIKNVLFDKLMQYKSIANGTEEKSVILDVVEGQQNDSEYSLAFDEVIRNIKRSPKYNRTTDDFLKGCIKRVRQGMILTPMQQKKLNNIHFICTGRNADGTVPGKPKAQQEETTSQEKQFLMMNLNNPIKVKHALSCCERTLQMNHLDNVVFLNLLEDLRIMSPDSNLPRELFNRMSIFKDKMPVCAKAFMYKYEEAEPDEYIISLFNKIVDNEFTFDKRADTTDIYSAFMITVMNDLSFAMPNSWKEIIENNTAKKHARQCIKMITKLLFVDCVQL